MRDFLATKIRKVCRKRSPAKGVWQKSHEKSDRRIRQGDQKVTERVPKTKKSDRTPFADLSLWHPEIRKVWVSIKFLSAKFGFTPPPREGPKMRKNCTSVENPQNLHTFRGGGVGNAIVRTVGCSGAKPMGIQPPSPSLPFHTTHFICLYSFLYSLCRVDAHGMFWPRGEYALHWR